MYNVIPYTFMALGRAREIGSKIMNTVELVLVIALVIIPMAAVIRSIFGNRQS